MTKVNLSDYQKCVLNLLKNGGYITHNEGTSLEAYYISDTSEKDKKIRINTINKLYNLGALQYIDEFSYRLVLNPTFKY